MTQPPQDRPDYPWGPGEGDRSGRATPSAPTESLPPAQAPAPSAPPTGGSTRMGGSSSPGRADAPYTGTPMSALPPLGAPSTGATGSEHEPYTGTPARPVAGTAGAPHDPEGATPVSTIVLLVLSGLAVFTGWFTLAGIPGAALAIVALTRTGSDPAGARRLTRIGWWIFGGLVLLGVALAIIGVVLLFVLGDTAVSTGFSGVGPVTPLTALTGAA